jgi:hypothetical protein
MDDGDHMLCYIQSPCGYDGIQHCVASITYVDGPTYFLLVIHVEPVPVDFDTIRPHTERPVIPNLEPAQHQPVIE